MIVAERIAALVPSMRQRAARLDDDAAFPGEDIDALRTAGALSLSLPVEHDRRDGDSLTLADQLADVLILIGSGNLAVGRIIEAHINTRHLIARFGTPAQRERADADVADGHLFALWVTDAPEHRLRVTRTGHRWLLEGGKMFCSAAGHATRALVTAMDRTGHQQMLVLPLGCERVRPLEAPLQGMRAAVTGAVDFSGCLVEADALLGEPGDYLREPDFSAGAWRGSAVALGGLQSLLEFMREQLTASGRLDNPHQLRRLGRALIAGETSRLWVRAVAHVAEDRNAEPAHAVAYTGLARIAVETACLDAMQRVQRSLGLTAFRRGNPVERICRDLATYLRQPAPDDVLTEAAAHFARPPK